ncbi:MAG: DoxX family protein [Chitinophagaceae bacterium]|nr:DoxX family protein [Chitinophagaceae bacterium]
MKQFFFGSAFTGNKAFNIAWLLFRFYIGFTIAIGAGWPKMNELAAPGWFVKQVSELGFNFPSPGFWAAAASWGEFVGGLCIAIGFFTRFSAIQLAFQFFVVSFIWYKEPAPMVGMYYQQLLFWGFVLIAVGGSGKYSIDNFIMKRKDLKISIKQVATTATVVLLLLTHASFAQNTTTVSAKDFQTIIGSWQGSLTYLDYTSGKPYTMSANLDVEQIGNSNAFRFSNSFPKEANANWTDTITISANGTMLNNEKVTSKKILADGSVVIVTEVMGADGNDNKPALLRHTYTIGRNFFSKRKDVKFVATKKWVKRHEYTYGRK